MLRESAQLLTDAYRLRVPVLIQLAGSDTVVSNSASRDFGARLAVTPEVVEYEGAYHALYFDPLAEQSLADLGRWLERRLTDEMAH
jgi:alpha-beta hydrolase superfamily lysophospholipase